MSELQDLLVALDGVTKEAKQHAAQLAQHARQLGQAASTAARATQGSGRSDSKQVAAALQSAQSSITQAAQHLHQAALAGKGFVARYAGGGTTGGEAGTVVGGYDAPDVTAVTLSGDDAAALGDYTGAGYREINESLRGNAAMTSDTKERADAISKALSKIPDRPGPVFRGTTLSQEQIASYVPGAVHSEAGFTSTTSDSKAAFPGNTLFLVISKHGKDVSPYSQYAESEVLFDKGADFLVTSNFYSPQEGKQVIVMMEV